jgi:hypothetical protein
MHPALHIIDNTGAEFKGNITGPKRISEAHLRKKPNAVVTSMLASNVSTAAFTEDVF